MPVAEKKAHVRRLARGINLKWQGISSLSDQRHCQYRTPLSIFFLSSVLPIVTQLALAVPTYMVIWRQFNSKTVPFHLVLKRICLISWKLKDLLLMIKYRMMMTSWSSPQRLIKLQPIIFHDVSLLCRECQLIMTASIRHCCSGPTECATLRLRISSSTSSYKKS